MSNNAAEPYVAPKYQTDPLPALAAGRTGKPEVLTSGGDQAVGSIQFANNPVADETITVNGTEFTFVASGASGNEINVAGSLALTLDNMISVLNASGDAEAAKVTWTEDGVDTLTGTYDADGVEGNDYTLAGSAGDETITAFSGGEDSRAISIDTEYTDIAVAAGQTQAQAFTLADGYEGQKKFIYLSAKQAGNVVITPANFHDGTTITFDADKEYISLVFYDGGWRSVGTNATVA